MEKFAVNSILSLYSLYKMTSPIAQRREKSGHFWETTSPKSPSSESPDAYVITGPFYYNFKLNLFIYLFILHWLWNMFLQLTTQPMIYIFRVYYQYFALILSILKTK
jgi:hypothetical protein